MDANVTCLRPAIVVELYAYRYVSEARVLIRVGRVILTAQLSHSAQLG
jgi:hypothetical protein